MAKHSFEAMCTRKQGIDRDRGVDESGNQLSLLKRRGSRPFNRKEMERLYLRDGQLYTVTDDPPGGAVRTGERSPVEVANQALAVGWALRRLFDLEGV